MAVKIQRYVYNLQAITMTYLPLFMMMNIDLNIYCVQVMEGSSIIPTQLYFEEYKKNFRAFP